MLDLIIRGGDVVTPQGVVQGDVAVAGETIAAIAAADVLSTETAERVINATGHIVIPGGIDPHVHLHHVWFKPDGSQLVTAGPEQVGRAAQSWSRKSERGDKWSFCLTAGTLCPANQERP